MMKPEQNEQLAAALVPARDSWDSQPRRFCWAGVFLAGKCLWDASLSLLEEECGLAAAVAKMDTSGEGSFSPEMLLSPGWVWGMGFLGKLS